MPFVDVVRRNTMRDCSEPKDKIYGLLALGNDLVDGDWPLKPRYDQTVEEIYKQFVWWCIAKSGTLDVLSSKRDYRVRSKLSSLPSWVPDWAEDGGRDTDSTPKTWSSGKGTAPRVSLSGEDNRILLVKGFVVDKVDQLAISYYQMTLWDGYQLFAQALQRGVDDALKREMIEMFLSQGVAPKYLYGLVQAQKAVQKYRVAGRTSLPAMRDIIWIESCKDVASGGSDQMSAKQYDAFWRTIIGNRASTEVPAPRYFKWSFKKWLDLMEDLRKDTRTLLQGMTPYPVNENVPAYEEWCRDPKALLYDDESQNWEAIHKLWLPYRRERFCSTVNSRLGWAPDSAQEGDLICIFYGAKMPHVLRPCGDGKYKLMGDA